MITRDVPGYCKSCLNIVIEVSGDASVPLQRYPDVEIPFEKVHRGIKNLMENSEKGYEYYSVRCAYTYLITEPLKLRKLEKYASIFDSVVCKQIVPKILVTEKGKRFVNHMLKGTYTSCNNHSIPPTGM